ncbi:hypothetical protein U1Q18_028957 [Sarracenia purpurea var. burkii]
MSSNKTTCSNIGDFTSWFSSAATPSSSILVLLGLPCAQPLCAAHHAPLNSSSVIDPLHRSVATGGESSLEIESSGRLTVGPDHPLWVRSPRLGIEGVAIDVVSFVTR